MDVVDPRIYWRRVRWVLEWGTDKEKERIQKIARVGSENSTYKKMMKIWEPVYERRMAELAKINEKNNKKYDRQ